MQSNGPLMMRLPRRRKARNNGPQLVSGNRKSNGIPRRVTRRRRDTGAMALSFPNQSRSYDATLRAVRFWGHDGAMEVSFFVTEDALKRIEPSMRSDESGLLNAFWACCFTPSSIPPTSRIATAESCCLQPCSDCILF